MANIDLTIKTLDSRNHQFNISPEVLFSLFKEHIASQVGTPAETQRLIYCGRVLQDEKKLSDYGLLYIHYLCIMSAILFSYLHFARIQIWMAKWCIWSSEHHPRPILHHHRRTPPLLVHLEPGLVMSITTWIVDSTTVLHMDMVVSHQHFFILNLELKFSLKRSHSSSGWK